MATLVPRPSTSAPVPPKPKTESRPRPEPKRRKRFRAAPAVRHAPTTRARSILTKGRSCSRCRRRIWVCRLWE
ncbi:hypothetical protein F3087_43905 [Nocardia colli]|uniref:Uncharacterized protein n=1 Tax=Nocardia colli TaxID=2545717 RepID=A0A5N0DSN4_9NOCA|nr:hypothetical protein F3087_43905 [Nocardia colli]